MRELQSHETYYQALFGGLESLIELEVQHYNDVHTFSKATLIDKNVSEKSKENCETQTDSNYNNRC